MSRPSNTAIDGRRYKADVLFSVTPPETTAEDPRVELMACLPEEARVCDLRGSRLAIRYDPTRISHTDIDATLQKLAWQPTRSRWARFLCQWREETLRAQMEQLSCWTTAVCYARIVCLPSRSGPGQGTTTGGRQWRRHMERAAPATAGATDKNRDGDDPGNGRD